jgi:hypothetical protein
MHHIGCRLTPITSFRPLLCRMRPESRDGGQSSPCSVHNNELRGEHHLPPAGVNSTPADALPPPWGFWGSLTEALRPGQLQNEAIVGEEDFLTAIYADPGRIIYC